jgi:hypothetical protein
VRAELSSQTTKIDPAQESTCKKRRLQQVPCIKAPHVQNKKERLCTIDEIFSNMHRSLRARKKKEGIHQVTSVYAVQTTQRKKYFDYFAFNIVDCGVNCSLPRSGARHRALTQTIGNARGLDINSPQSAENHPQDLRLHRHQQRDDPNSARGLDNNFASDRDCDSTTTTRLCHYRLRRANHAAPDIS